MHLLISITTNFDADKEKAYWQNKSIIEIDDFHEVSIGINIRVRIGKVKNDTDSWLHIKPPDFSILNLNDCVFDDKSLVDLHNEIGHVDLLLTQFSSSTLVNTLFDILEKEFLFIIE